MRDRVVSPREVVADLLERIHAINSRYNAFVDIFAEDALREALDSERRFMKGRPRGPLDGIPVAVKDLEALTGRRHTHGVRALADNVAGTTTPAVDRLVRAGANVLGKTNTPEFGHKGLTDNQLFGPSTTPFRAGMNAGGSSGGSAAAVAAGLVPLAQGGDGGGSIRIPAAMCGVVGYKPSAGAVPLAARPNGFSAPPYVSFGPIARTVGDAELMAAAMIAPHDGDPGSLPEGAVRLQPRAGAGPVESLRVAYLGTIGGLPVTSEVQTVVESAIELLREAGVTIQSVDLDLRHSHADFAQVWLDDVAVAYAEASAMYAEQGIDLIGGEPRGLPAALVDLIESGFAMSAVRYRQNGNLRTEMFDAIQRAFDDWDILLTPTLAVAGVPNGLDGETVGPSEVNEMPVDPLIGWCLTYPFNLTGHPAASVPAGCTEDGLPVGIQIVGPRWRDDLVLQLSYALESCNPWIDRLITVVDCE